MICPKCSEEVPGALFGQHTAYCRGQHGMKQSSPAAAQREYLTAKEAENAAHRHVSAMTLRSVTCCKGRVVQLGDTLSHAYQATEWLLSYDDPDQEPIRAWVTALEVRVVRKSQAAAEILRFFGSDDAAPLVDWNIDSDQACQIAARHGGNIQLSLLDLQVRVVANRPAPVWIVPYEKDFAPLKPTLLGQERRLMAIRGDTGAVLRWEGDLLTE